VTAEEYREVAATRRSYYVLVTDPYDEDLPFDSTVAHPARVYDYWLGGKDNFAADREAGDEVLRAKPGIRQNVRANRAFLGRCVRFLAGEAGIRQFLDIGTGIPSAGNTHEVALDVDPDCRVVYVDDDLMVLRHAQALLTSATGTVAYLDMDARDTSKILAAAADTLDFGKPVAVMLIAILHLIPDGDDPWRLVADLMAAVAPGSYLAITHPASDIAPEASARASRAYNDNVATPQTRRSRDEIARFFTGLDLVAPGLVQLPDWRPAAADLLAPTSGYGAVARKP
jgi:S-adenosyl methyltransferase